MKARLVLRSVVVLVTATAGFVGAGAQPSLGDNSPLATATITSPQEDQTVSSDVTVQAQATGQQVDPPHKIQFFVDHSKQPSATVTCYTDLADPSYYCGAQWVWHTAHRLVGRHSVAAKVVLLDGKTSARSTPVNVTVLAQTRLKIHRRAHVMAGQKVTLAGRVTVQIHGRPGARHMPVVLNVTNRRMTKDFHVRTNSHGYYRKKVRAISNLTVTVGTKDTRKYIGNGGYSYPTYGKAYVQFVRGRPHCHLSKSHARVNHVVVLRCRFKHLYTGARYQVQNRVHGKWREAAHFKTLRNGGNKLFIRFRKPTTVTMREVFARSSVFDRSRSNAVRLHVT